jgi:hypothetical protein
MGFLELKSALKNNCSLIDFRKTNNLNNKLRASSTRGLSKGSSHLGSSKNGRKVFADTFLSNSL